MPSDDTVWKSDELAERYLEGVRQAIPMAAEQIRVLLAILRQSVPELKTFLDLGCGDGILGRAILSQFPSARGVFLDFSEYMLEATREALGDEAGRHQYVCMDYADPRWIRLFQAGTFDTVVSAFSIHHQSDTRKRVLYREIFDLLAPGGVFLNLEHVASTSRWGQRIFDEYFIDSLYRFQLEAGQGRTREEVAADYHARPDKTANVLARVTDQCRWLQEIGFSRVDCFFKVFELALFGGCKLGGR